VPGIPVTKRYFIVIQNLFAKLPFAETSNVLFVVSSSTALCQQQVHRTQSGGYFVCVGPDLTSLVPSDLTSPHLCHLYHQVVEFSHAVLSLGWTSSPRIWTNVMSVVVAALCHHDMCTLLCRRSVDLLLLLRGSLKGASQE
jgi:hypothetical protein